MSETLQEYVDSRGVAMRVDRGQGILRGVKVLGLESRNGRTYLAEALEKAAALYEGARVNVNHPKSSPLAPRDYQDRIGNLRNVSVRAGEGLFADFHFNPKHALAEQLVWDAEHSPRNVGFSHNVLARTTRRGDRTVVEAITRVQSVDLVADPATTQGLFESVDESDEYASPAALADAAVASFEESESDPAETSLEEQAGQLEPLRDELARAQAELEQLRDAQAQAQRRVLIHQLLDEAGLCGPSKGPHHDPTVVTERFIELLAQAPDESTVRELIRDRAELVESMRRGVASEARPRSRDQSMLTSRRSSDAKSFVKAIT